MSTFVDFIPSPITPFQFQPSLANGQQYAVSIPWNEFGQRYYVDVYDLAGNLIVSRGLVPSGPTLTCALVWSAGIARATTLVPHYVPLATLANVRIAQSNSTFDGVVQALSVGDMDLTFSLLVDPKQSIAIPGKVNFDLDLLAGYEIGSLWFHQDTQQFEF